MTKKNRRDGTAERRVRSVLPTTDLRYVSTRLLEVDLEITGRIQPVDRELVKRIQRSMRLGAPVEYLLVFVIGPPRDQRWIVIDGRARLAAAIALGKSEIAARVFFGTRGDARWAAAGANQTNGTPLTVAERRRALDLAIEADPLASDREIAVQTRSTPSAVWHRRKALGHEPLSESPEPLPEETLPE
jgi:hypothetical protein